METTWKPTTAGILTIIAGALNLAMGILSVTAMRGAVWPSMGHPWFGGMGYGMMGYGMMGMSWLGAIGISLIVLGVISVIGGIFALQRRVWGLALAGAICALFPPPLIVLGILSTIFLALSRKEFAQS